MNPERLRLVHAFADLPGDELVLLAARAQEGAAAGGSVLLHEDDYATDLILILQGAVEIRRGGALIAALRAGELFGELGCITGRRRNATVTATEDVQFARLTHWDLRRLRLGAPQAHAALHAIAADREAVAPLAA